MWHYPVVPRRDLVEYAKLLETVLDKGVVIDAWTRVSVLGLDLFTVQARVVVTSLDTYLRYADAIAAIT